jgi:phage terminase small subunit
MNDLSEKQKSFCREFIKDFNGKQAAIRAGYSIKTANEQASRLLTKVHVQSYIESLTNKAAIKNDLTIEKVINEFQKIAFTSIAHLHNTWIERKDFETLTEDQKSAIESIETKIVKKVEKEFDGETFVNVPYEIEFVKIKLYDKQRALENLGKYLGVYAKDNNQKSPHSDLTEEETKLRIAQLKKQLGIG